MWYETLWILLGIAAFFMIFGNSVPAYTGVIIGRFGKPVWSRGPGLYFSIPFYHTLEATVSLKKKPKKFDYVAETAEDDQVLLKVAYEYSAVSKYLENFCDFETADIESAIQGVLESLLGKHLRTYQDRGTAMNSGPAIAKAVKTAFESETAEDGQTKLQEFYGIDLESFRIVDMALPEKLAEAETKKEIMEQENEAKALDMQNVKKLAGELVEEAEKRGDKLKYEEAMKIVQIQQSKIVKNVNETGIDLRLAEAIGNFGSGGKKLLDAAGNFFSGNKK